MTTACRSPTRAGASLRDLRVAAPASVGFGALVADRPCRPLRADRDAAGPRIRRLERPRRVMGRPGAETGRRSSRASEPRSAARSRVRDALPARLAGAISRRLDGDRRVRIPLDLRGHTPFEVMVWMKALEIPRGEVRPYGWIAAEIGRPRAVRAVGTALAHNPVPLVVPCHRVVRSDGLIGQYSMGGPDAKRRVLGSEGLDTGALEADAAAGAATPARTRRTSCATRPAATRDGSRIATGSRSRASRPRHRRATGRASTAGPSRWPPDRSARRPRAPGTSDSGSAGRRGPCPTTR